MNICSFIQTAGKLFKYNYLMNEEWGVVSTQEDGECETWVLRLFEETFACEKQYEEIRGKWFV